MNPAPQELSAEHSTVEGRCWRACISCEWASSVFMFVSVPGGSESARSDFNWGCRAVFCYSRGGEGVGLGMEQIYCFHHRRIQNCVGMILGNKEQGWTLHCGPITVDRSWWLTRTVFLSVGKSVEQWCFRVPITASRPKQLLGRLFVVYDVSEVTSTSVLR